MSSLLRPAICSEEQMEIVSYARGIGGASTGLAAVFAPPHFLPSWPLLPCCFALILYISDVPGYNVIQYHPTPNSTIN